MLRRAGVARSRSRSRSAVTARPSPSPALSMSVATTRRSLSGRSTCTSGGRLHGSHRLLHPSPRVALSLPLPSSSVASGLGLSFLQSGVSGGGQRKTSSASRVIFTAPPEDLGEAYFERPTPLLLVAGEGQPATRWDGVASFFARRGCTVGTIALTGRGGSPTETLGLRALQSGVAAAVEKSGLTPPVILAHSMAGFVCQQYLQSYSASGLVLLDSFPPNPSALAIEHLKLASARAGDPRRAGVLPETPPGPTSHELAKLMNDDPARWEGLLRAYFDKVHHLSALHAIPGFGGHGDVTAEIGSVEGGGPRFPVKAFAQMCLGRPCSTLRLESHVVETLVLGSDVGGAKTVGVPPAGAGDRSSPALKSAKKDALEAICEFHGTQGWSGVDNLGMVRSEEGGSPEPWQEVVWEWYDARF